MIRFADFVKNPTSLVVGPLTVSWGSDRLANLSSPSALSIVLVSELIHVREMRSFWTRPHSMTSDSESDPEKADDRAPSAKAYDVSTRIFSAALSIGLFAWVGFWLDRKLGWKGPLLITGVLLGIAVFLQQMWSLVASTAPSRSQRSKPGE